MNTKFLKRIILILILTTLTIVFIFNQKKSTPRQIANESTIDYSKLTDGQKTKWSAIEKFKVQTDNESLVIDIPHISDICQHDTKYIIFTFKAYQNLLAGQNPHIKIHFSCKKQPQFPIQIPKSLLTSLQQNATLKNDLYYLQSHLIYKDEPFPNEWSLQEIQVQGENSYIMNEYEIQSVFNHNFEFEMF